jgi:MoxR-like ATPase
VTGRPGTGKSSLARAIAEELQLGEVLVWSITSRSTLQQGLYEYDGIARVQETARWQNAANDPKARKALAIENFLTLGPLGTALADSTSERPRVLLVDEIDKSDIDLPNDLLHVFEEGEFTIPELRRASEAEGRSRVEVPLHGEMKTGAAGMEKQRGAWVERGRVQCRAFPIVLLTSNGEREFPPAFLRRCLRVDIPRPMRPQLEKIVTQRLGIDATANADAKRIVDLFEKLRDTERRELATDQLLNAIHLVCNGKGPAEEEFLRKIILRALSEGDGAN